MAFFDLPLRELEHYRPPLTQPENFDTFWDHTLAETRQHPLNAQFTPYDSGLKTVEVFDLSFAGFAGHPIKGWLLLPRERPEPLPCVVEYIGYGGGRGLPIDWLVWSGAGYAHLVMDTRGQGSAWLQGDTADPEGSAPHHPGFMTRGILNPARYYYRRLISDAVRAVDVALEHPEIDPKHVAVTGRSQGGGLALAVAGLHDQVEVSMPDVPFLCHFRRASEITDSLPYAEIARYCKVHRQQIEQVFTTLAYVDGMNLAPRATANALFSVALMDTICPPSTVFAAYNHYAGEKEIRVWPYNNHEGGQSHHQLEQIRFLKRLWS